MSVKPILNHLEMLVFPTGRRVQFMALSETHTVAIGPNNSWRCDDDNDDHA